MRKERFDKEGEIGPVRLRESRYKTLTRVGLSGLLQVMPNHLHGSRVLLDHEDKAPAGSERRDLKVRRAARSSTEPVAEAV